jgi:transposase
MVPTRYSNTKALMSMHHQKVDVTGGVDTHAETPVATAVDQVGGILATGSFPANASGYSQLLERMHRLGDLGRVGVEGTGAYGAGLVRHLTAEGVKVIEVDRPNRQLRRRRGKSDPVDAEAAARAAPLRAGTTGRGHSL